MICPSVDPCLEYVGQTDQNSSLLQSSVKYSIISQCVFESQVCKHRDNDDLKNLISITLVCFPCDNFCVEFFGRFWHISLEVLIIDLNLTLISSVSCKKKAYLRGIYFICNFSLFPLILDTEMSQNLQKNSTQKLSQEKYTHVILSHHLFLIVSISENFDSKFPKTYLPKCCAAKIYQFSIFIILIQSKRQYLQYIRTSIQWSSE